MDHRLWIIPYETTIESFNFSGLVYQIKVNFSASIDDRTSNMEKLSALGRNIFLFANNDSDNNVSIRLSVAWIPSVFAR